MNIRLFPMPDNPALPQGIAHHVDLSVFHAGDNKLILSRSYKGSEFEKALIAEGFEISFFSCEQCKEYPGDSGGNVCYYGEYSFYNPLSADPMIKQYLDSKNTVQIHVKQGYTKCNICVLDDHAIITNDRIIAEKAENQGIDVLLSDPSNIRLEGYDHGFIGGSAFKIASDILCFTGVMEAFEKTEKNKILDFCRKKQIEPVYLSDLPLFDIGGAVPLLEL